MFSPEMLAAAQKMMANMTPEQMSQVAGMASKMNPDMLKNLSGGNAGLPMPTPAQFDEAKEKMKNMSAEDMKSMFTAASGKMAGQNAYMVSGATLLKNEGNSKVRSGDYAGGVEVFQKALGNLESCPAPDQEVLSLVQSIKLNMALCYLKLQKFDDCESTCNSILESDPKSIKAMYRRGVAKRELGHVAEGAIDLKRSMLLSEHKDEVINAEFEKTLQLISDPVEMKKVDDSGLEEEVAAAPAPIPPAEASSNLAKAKEIIEKNPDVMDRMGDVISQLDDDQLDGILSMSAAGSGISGGAGMPDLSEMKKILKNRDFMKSMTEMMKNMDPAAMEGMMGRAGANARETASGSASSSSTAAVPAGMPDVSKMMEDPNMLKSVESMIDSMPDSMLEEMLAGAVPEGQAKARPAFLTGSRMKWIAKRVMGLIRIWLMIKRFIAICFTMKGRIVIAIIVIVAGLYQQYGHLLHKPEKREHNQIMIKEL